MARRREDIARNGLNIILVGCGKVGASLVEKLSQEGHNITVVDQDAAAVAAVTDLYDVSGVAGNGASYRVQQEAGIDEADVLISVTASDELNLLCCIVAKRTGNCAVIARVRTPDYSEDAEYLKEKLGLAMIINPEREAALAIARLLCLPTALGVTGFAGGHAEMVRIRIPQGNMLDGRYLRELGRELAGPVLVCAVERAGQVYIPGGSFQLRSGDAVTFLCPSRDSKQFLGRMGLATRQVHDALLIGGSRAAYYLARRLLAVGVQVRIIEADLARCEELSCLLPKATILHGDGTDVDLLREAGIQRAGAVVPLTGIDEENILLTLHARAVAPGAKAVTKINRIMYPEAVGRLDLGSVICPKHLTTEAIVAFVRSRSASKNSNIEALMHMFDDRVEAIEFLAGEGSPLLDIPLRELALKDHLLIGCLFREGRMLIPGGDDCIRAGDRIIVVTTHTGLRELADILA